MQTLDVNEKIARVPFSIFLRRVLRSMLRLCFAKMPSLLVKEVIDDTAVLINLPKRTKKERKRC